MERTRTWGHCKQTADTGVYDGCFKLYTCPRSAGKSRGGALGKRGPRLEPGTKEYPPVLLFQQVTDGSRGIGFGIA